MVEAPNILHFVATFADGSQIVQTAEDAGTVEGRNCYYDVLQRQKEVPLICFVLAAENYPTFGVDLRDGHFEVNGVPFFQHTQPLKDFSLVYFRNVSQHRTVRVDGTGEPDDWAEVGYDIGWKTENDGGEAVERVMRIVL